mgnify:CR=1 FL=1
MRTDNLINYKISTNNIHITDSFQYTTKKEMKEIIQYLKKLYPIISYLQGLFHH